MSSKASSRSDEEVLVTGDSAGVPLVTVTTELPVHVPHEPASNEVAAAAAGADDVVASKTDVSVDGAVSTEPASAGAEGEGRPGATNAAPAIAEEVTAAYRAENVATQAAERELASGAAETATSESATAEAADRSLTETTAKARMPRGPVVEAADQTGDAPAEVVAETDVALVETAPADAGDSDKGELPSAELGHAGDSVTAASETGAEHTTEAEAVSAVAADEPTVASSESSSSAPPADDDLASLVSALADAQGAQPEAHQIMASALLAGTAAPRSFVSNSSNAGGSETFADHTAEPSTVLDATDLVIDADAETGVRHKPSPRSTMLGRGTCV
ncbi:MAG TPA: hypothetical protein VGF45_09020, partial [Polyangia bacterium]